MREFGIFFFIGQCFCFAGGFWNDWEMQHDDQTRSTNTSDTVRHIFQFLRWIKSMAILLFFFFFCVTDLNLNSMCVSIDNDVREKFLSQPCWHRNFYTDLSFLEPNFATQNHSKKDCFWWDTSAQKWNWANSAATFNSTLGRRYYARTVLCALLCH